MMSSSSSDTLRCTPRPPQRRSRSAPATEDLDATPKLNSLNSLSLRNLNDDDEEDDDNDLFSVTRTPEELALYARFGDDYDEVVRAMPRAVTATPRWASTMPP